MKQRSCTASFVRFSHYASTARPDHDGRVACPECGKTVQLMRLKPEAVTRERIPIHRPLRIDS
jgi:hypothetical protein